MTDFLLELRSEEIPARMQAGARTDLEKLFRKAMADAGVSHGELTVWSTPRRLALIARDLPEATQPVSEEVKGPKVGAPPQALEGFLRKTGLAQDQLTERNGVYFAVTEKPGRATREVLAEAIPAIVRAFPWPKSMRWGAASISTESLRWVRPLSGIVAILGEELVECEVGGVQSGYATLGHRFHHCGEITIGGASDYQEKLRACHVIVDHAERQDLIREEARSIAAEAGLTLVEDEGLVIENAGLTEWPVPLLGRFDEAFLEVPPEVIQLTARTNQKYFVCNSPLPLAGGPGGGPVDGTSTASMPTPDPSREREGNLANAFVCTANIQASDGGAAIVDGNRKVLAARLSDARFFWEQDRKKSLAQHAEGLARITFHEKLGTVADKVERVAKLARWLVEEGIVSPLPLAGGAGGGPVDGTSTASMPTPNPSREREGDDVAQLATLAEQAARLCKADLVTEMVGEFPELQGVMGGYYARAEGLPDAVAEAIRDHYKPVGQGDDVPTAPVTVAVSLADKLDTLVSFFMIQETPTGSKDPFALRRAALGIIALILKNDIRLSFLDAYSMAAFFSASDSLAHSHEVLRRRLLRSKLDPKIEFSPEERELLQDLSDNPMEWVRTGVIAMGHDTVKFMADRLKVQQREAGVRHDLIDAVFALGGEDDLVRLLARVHALQAFVGTADGANLLAAYKRAANILKKEAWEGPSPLQGRGRSDLSLSKGAEGVGGVDQAQRPADTPHPNPSPGSEADPMGQREGPETRIPRDGEEDPFALVDDPDVAAAVAARAAMMRKTLSYTPEAEENALIAVLDSTEPRAAAAIAAEDFAGAMSALASLRAPIDSFFDKVTVNDPDPAKRTARLDLLARFRDAVHQVADFSRIEG